jgi:hypothetical protein
MVSPAGVGGSLSDGSVSLMKFPKIDRPGAES